jgi:segregation and condensation protein B
MELAIITPHIEALIFASDKPISNLELTDLINNALSFMDDRATTEEIDVVLKTLGEKYSSDVFSFELKESGGGFQFLTKPAYYKTVALLHGDKYLKRLSTAALETLAIIAYKQPVTKGEMEHIRGVNCDYAVQKLLEKELISIIGRREGSPGQPLEYAASRSFMDYFGVNSLDELPKLNDLFPQDRIEATTVTEAHPVEEDIIGEAELHMAVNENGDVVELPEEKTDNEVQS